jgi:hypothetical protein
LRLFFVEDIVPPVFELFAFCFAARTEPAPKANVRASAVALTSFFMVFKVSPSSLD